MHSVVVGVVLFLCTPLALKGDKMSRHSPEVVEVPVITSSPKKSSSPMGVGKDGHPPPAGFPFQSHDQPPPPVVTVPVVAYVAEPVPPPPSCLDICLATLCCCCLLDTCFPPYGPFPFF
ncbi:cysteine-rich and transmembrane domain-containing protein WIH2-like [Rhododendron vialii]|uniref:cysteine-rich and transmembrane domain-containing protein WIH2-like n=1 Tax=Rhododendron vialii TaxID=182163 RepID=UPI00265E6454|nr:cysteine-rich and transmembrane domain-containing protein WIH2-like [Rhododendron vialii]